MSKSSFNSAFNMFSSFSFMKLVQIISSSHGASNSNRDFIDDEDAEIPLSPVPHLLNSNFPPSDNERNKINAILVIARQRLAKLQSRNVGSVGDVNRKSTGRESEIGRGQLEKPISLNLTFIQAHESINSCLRYLPVELIQLIFIQCLPTFDYHDWKRNPAKYGPTFTLSQVCRRWRQIAHDTPQLWAVMGKIRLKALKLNERWDDSTVFFINEFLQRSRNQGLWFDISARSLENLAHPLINLILQHSNRWEVVTVGSTWPAIASIFCSNLPRSSGTRLFPRLRRLGIGIWTMEPVSNGVFEFKFKGAPILEGLSIMGFTPTNLALPLDGLKHYRQFVFNDTASPLSNVLKNSQGIEQLEIIDLVAFDKTVLPSRICLDHLSIFHLKMNTNIPESWDGIGSLLDLLALPSLAELKVAGCPGVGLVSKLTSLLRRSRCILRTLCLSTSDAFPRDLDRLLELTPQLEELDVDIPSMMDMFVLGVGNNPSRSGGAVVPNLKRLTLRFPSPDDIERCARLLSLIAHARFNQPPSSNEGDSVIPLTLGPSHAAARSPNWPCFRLVFADMDTTIAAQVYLYSCAKAQNASPTLGNDSMRYFSNFLTWRSRLHEELPELNGMPAPGKRRLDLGFSQRLNRLLMEIEAVETSGCLNLRLLLTSKLHHSLRLLTHIRPGYIQGDNTYKYQERSIDILKKWERLLKNDMANLDWALMAWNKSLVFVPENDTLRRDRDIFQMIYGMEDTLSTEELNWMSYM